MAASPHRLTLRVYYEDTDLAGIVYYANYLKFIERARTEWVRELGVDQGTLKSEAGIVFAVRRVEVEYLRPARFDDVIEVETECMDCSAAKVVLAQRVLRDGVPLVDARVTVVALSDTGRPVRLPAVFRRALEDTRR